MERCNATFKLAIKFVNWLDNGPDDYYWHIFGNLPYNQGPKVAMYHHWLKNKLAGNSKAFAHSVDAGAALCEAKKAPKSGIGEQQAQRINYAFHLDAGLVAELLKEKAVQGGVEHLVSKVQDVKLDENDFIQQVLTDQGDRLEADLFIDCSGFSSLLIEKAMKEPWESYEDCLFADRAIAIGRLYAEDDPYNEKNGGLNSYTSATAINAGWIWHTPLVSRDGNGYVYSSRFISDDKAEAEMRQHLGTDLPTTDPRYLKMRIGKVRRSWVRNCVSLGLAGGFIEPLESTGLALIQIGIQHLVHCFPDKAFNPAMIAHYNRIMTEQYENIRDFIVLHYCLTKREDTPFWKAVKHETKIPDSLQEKLDLWKVMWPNDVRGSGRMFGPYNFVSILAGMEYLPKQCLPLLSFESDEEQQAKQFFKQVESMGTGLVQKLPGQGEYFQQLKRIREFRMNKSW